ncbi:MAG: hypothetical protein ABIO70_25775 [Pseudomonadota bacterium]
MRRLGKWIRWASLAGATLVSFAASGCHSCEGYWGQVEFSTTDFFEISDVPTDTADEIAGFLLGISQSSGLGTGVGIDLTEVEGKGLTFSQPERMDLGSVAEEHYAPESITLHYSLVFLWNWGGPAVDDTYPSLDFPGGSEAELWNGWRINLAWLTSHMGCE